MTHIHDGAAISGPALLRSLADNWWLILLRGIAAILFGVLAFIWPGLTLITLTYLWGIYALADGIFALWAAISGQGAAVAPRWWLALVGICGILAGLIAFFWPGMTTLILLTFIAVWAIIVGILEIWGAIQLRGEMDVGLLAMTGALSILFGVIVLARPEAGALSLVWIIASFAILAGCGLIALAFRVRTYKQSP
jgi:uncharacterized membrane protein HdeD (DUF308 family)